MAKKFVTVEVTVSLDTEAYAPDVVGDQLEFTLNRDGFTIEDYETKDWGVVENGNLRSEAE